jgi:putative phage-type endonuclease
MSESEYSGFEISKTISIANSASESDTEYSGFVIDNNNNSLDDSSSDEYDDIIPNIKLPDDLVNHIYDFRHKKYTEKDHIYKEKQIEKLKAIKQYEQKSEGWFKQRDGCLTATAVSTVIDDNPYEYPVELFLDKCGRKKDFIVSEPTHHGNKYEEIASMFYSYRNNIEVYEYGLLQHPIHKFIGASPDGICEKNRYDQNKHSYPETKESVDNKELSTLVGRLLEIKCPYSRTILTKGKLDGDMCPHYYYIQVQTQLYVTGMSECDFLQCCIKEYSCWDDFVDDSHPRIDSISKTTGLEKGCIIQLFDKSKLSDPKCHLHAKYIYPKKLHMTNSEIKQWIAEVFIEFGSTPDSKSHILVKPIYWHLRNFTCNLIKLDKQKYEKEIIPMLNQFWNYVEYFKRKPKKLDKIETLIKKHGKDSSKKIFKYINDEYCAATGEKCKQLYKEPSEWRKIYNLKKH